MKILTAAQMAEVDRLTTDRYLIPSVLLMENAGRSVADELERACPGLDKKRILIFCGRGNNGGDGFVVARYLALRNANPSIILLSDPEKLKGDALINFNIVRALGVTIHVLATSAEARSYLKKAAAPDVIVDALFGTGLAKPIGPDFSHVVDWVNKMSRAAFVVAVDIPSGLFADSFSIPGPAVRAHMTVTFSALKLAQVMPPASDFAGKVIMVPIGSPSALLESSEYRMNLIDSALVRKTLPGRASNSHKGTYGHVYVVAGSRGKSGAALMTGIAALRSGSGLVTLWLPKSLQRGVVGKFPELMTEFLPETYEGALDQSGAGQVLDQLAQVDALVIGPGMTVHQSTRKLVWEIVRHSPVPVVVDADGINAFVPPAPSMRNETGQPVILTPHPGEMARLAGKKISEVQQDRIATARSWAESSGCYVVLKGYQTILAAPSGEIFVNSTGNPGMATGGTGDILAGMMGRFVAGWKCQSGRENSLGLTDYACSAVYLHGLAGDFAAEDKGEESLIATDLLSFLPKAFKKVTNR